MVHLVSVPSTQQTVTAEDEVGGREIGIDVGSSELADRTAAACET